MSKSKSTKDFVHISEIVDLLVEMYEKKQHNGIFEINITIQTKTKPFVVNQLCEIADKINEDGLKPNFYFKGGDNGNYNVIIREGGA